MGHRKKAKHRNNQRFSSQDVIAVATVVSTLISVIRLIIDIIGR